MIPFPSNLQIRFLHIGVFFRISLPYTRREAKAMKKIIILLLALLMSACSAVKPSETLSSMQTEPTETTVADTQVTEVTEAPTTKETGPVIETPKTETTEPTANADCIYLERDLTHRLDRYKRDDDITAVNIWAERLGNGNYLIYIAYA